MRMIIFPYGHDCEPIVRHISLMESCYEVVALVSPGGWGFAGKNIMLDNEKILSVYGSPKEVIEEFDSLFIPDFEVVNEKVESRLVDEMVRLIPRLSHICCAACLTEANNKRLKDACNHSQTCDFLDYSEYKGAEAYGLTEPVVKFPSLQIIDVPVIIVAGVWEKTDKFEISLALRERFLRDNYYVSQVGSKSYCEMMGFHSFPGFMFRKDIDAAQKVVYFNRWIKKIVREEQADLVLITIPGAIQDLNAQFTRGFGILHHQVFQAVTPDFLVMCTFYMADLKEVLDEMSKFCKYRFGATVDVFHMSNLFIDLNDSEQRKQIVTNSIYRETVSAAINKGFTSSSIPIFNGVDSEECDKIYKIIMDKLLPKETQVVF